VRNSAHSKYSGIFTWNNIIKNQYLAEKYPVGTTLAIEIGENA
jgi:hypothetical protein